MSKSSKMLERLHIERLEDPANRPYYASSLAELEAVTTDSDFQALEKMLECSRRRQLMEWTWLAERKARTCCICLEDSTRLAKYRHGCECTKRTTCTDCAPLTDRCPMCRKGRYTKRKKANN
jgi:hypothetical protein